MKRMIILGSCLVAGAVMYGFADYLHTDKEDLKRMYDNVPQKKEASVIGKSPIVGPAEHRIRLDAYSRSALVQQPLTIDSTELNPAPAKKK